MKVFCLLGPTCSGKTKLALEIASQFPCHLISVDSAMVYRGLDIGTAKPESEILKKFPHALINICDPSQPYSAGQFRQEAIQEIEKAKKENKIPLLVGGTMLYFHVLQNGLSDLPVADLTVRKNINEEAKKFGWETLHKKLKEIDPISSKRIHPNDPQRLQRALEIFYLTGKTPTEFYQDKQSELSYQFVNFALITDDREKLHEKIAQRFETMIKKGLLEEVEHLFKRGDLQENLPSIRSVNYRQLWEYFEGKTDLPTAKEKAVIATRQLAKRQLTWLRNHKNLSWIEPNIQNIYSSILEHI